MRRSLIKNNFKSIIKTRRRFLSILVMAFLGVGFYSGLVASSPDMLDSLDKYADENNMYDIGIVSTLGLTDEDVDEIKKIDGIENAYGIQTKDSMAEFENKENACTVIEYNESINIPYVVNGRLPENSGECLLDSGYIMTNHSADEYIGKKIVLKNDDKNEDDSSIFTCKEFTIVGIANSPLYISGERGNTSLGSGSIAYYIYVQNDVINLDYYTGIYAIVDGARDVTTNSDEYLALVNPVIDKIDQIKETRQDARYNSLIDEANSKLNDAQKEYDDKKKEVEDELNDAEKQINDAKDEISKNEDKLNSSEKELNAQEKSANSKFSQAEKQINEAENTIKDKEAELSKGKAELETKKKEAQDGINSLNSGIEQANESIKQLEEQKKLLVANRCRYK